MKKVIATLMIFVFALPAVAQTSFTQGYNYNIIELQTAKNMNGPLTVQFCIDLNRYGTDGTTSGIGALCADVVSYLTSLVNLQANYDELSGLYNALKINRDEWALYGTQAESKRSTLAGMVKTRDSLIKKLRKACGSKCKKIK